MFWEPSRVHIPVLWGRVVPCISSHLSSDCRESGLRSAHSRGHISTCCFIHLSCPVAPCVPVWGDSILSCSCCEVILSCSGFFSRAASGLPCVSITFPSFWHLKRGWSREPADGYCPQKTVSGFNCRGAFHLAVQILFLPSLFFIYLYHILFIYFSFHLGWVLVTIFGFFIG